METHVLKRGRRKHEQIYEIIRGEIADGLLEAGAPLASEADLCTRFDVSRGPVRQALAELQRRGLVRRHPGKGSFVSGGGSRPVQVDAEVGVRQLLVLINALGVNPGNFVVNEIVDGLSAAAEGVGRGYRLGFQFYRGGALSPEMLVDCDAMVMVPFTDEAVRMFGVLSDELPVPKVSIYNAVKSEGFPQFHVDHEAGAYDAAELLVRYGHKRIAMIAEPAISPGPAASQRESGFLRAVEVGRMDGVVGEIHRVGIDPLMRRGNIERLLRQSNRPTALVVAGGVLTPFVLDAVRSVGLSVPQDISLVAFDDTPEAASYQPRLAVVKMPLKRLSSMGIDSLVMQLEGQFQGDDRAPIAVKPDVIIAGSVGPAPRTDSAT